MSDVQFELAVPGYHRKQVRRYIDDLVRRLSAALAGLDAAASLPDALAAAEAEIERLRELNRYLPGPRETGHRIDRIFALAEEQAATMRAEVKREVDAIRAAAERDAAAMREAAKQDAAMVREAAERDATDIKERALAEAVQARREFEAALRARRDREQRCDEVLREFSAGTAAGGRGGSRARRS